MEQQTAVEWYAEQDNLATIDFIEGRMNQIALVRTKATILERAKQLEKKQIMIANMKNLPIEDGVITAVQKAENYYNETFKSKPEGNCPVQAEGYFMNHYFYFRARYEEATIEFAKNYSDYLSFKGIKYFILVKTTPYKAGWLPKWKCLLLIYKGCFKFFINQTFKTK